MATIRRAGADPPEGDARGRRLELLAHPWVVGSIALLAVNDHVLKGWPVGASGPLAGTMALATGTLSDLAGVAMAALVLGLVSGRRTRSVVAAGVGFAALKLSPTVAHLAAPLLGGASTRQDATDLLALVVLVPVHRFLARAEAPVDPATSRPHAVSRAGRRPASPALTAAVAGLAVLATTATSPPEEPRASSSWTSPVRCMRLRWTDRSRRRRVGGRGRLGDHRRRGADLAEHAPARPGVGDRPRRSSRLQRRRHRVHLG